MKSENIYLYIFWNNNIANILKTAEPRSPGWWRPNRKWMRCLQWRRMALLKVRESLSHSHIHKTGSSAQWHRIFERIPPPHTFILLILVATRSNSSNPLPVSAPSVWYTCVVLEKLVPFEIKCRAFLRFYSVSSLESHHHFMHLFYVELIFGTVESAAEAVTFTDQKVSVWTWRAGDRCGCSFRDERR